MSNNKKNHQLGMSYGTACGRLRKSILFSLVIRLGLHICFRCGEEITTPEELSIDHKHPWLESPEPVKTFFDLENISFSHLSCNSRAGKRHKKYSTEEEKILARRISNAESERRRYTPEARNRKYLETGH